MKQYISLILVVFLIGCATTPIVRSSKWEFDPEIHSRDDIEKLFVMFKGHWWNYYGRGMTFMEGGYWEDAVKDFKKSISLLSKDQRSARTYGLNRMDYFANRELGITYYKNDKYEDALKHLKLSLGNVESPRAVFYLKQVLKEIGGSSLPEIEILSHNEQDIIDHDIIKLKVKITTENNYIDSVWINNKQMFVDLRKKIFQFEKTIRLKEKDKLEEKKYQIKIEAANLTGDKNSKTIKIKLTRQNIIKKKVENKLGNLNNYKAGRHLLASATNDNLMIKRVLSAIGNNGAKEVTGAGSQTANNRDCDPMLIEEILFPQERYAVLLLPFISKTPRKAINDKDYLDTLFHNELHNSFETDNNPRFKYIAYDKKRFDEERIKIKLHNTDLYHADIKNIKDFIGDVIDEKAMKNETKVDGILAGTLEEKKELYSIGELQKYMDEPQHIVDKERLDKILDKTKALNDKENVDIDSTILLSMFEIEILFYDYDEPDRHLFERPIGIVGITDQSPSKEFLQNLAKKLYEKISVRYPSCGGEVIKILRRIIGRPGTRFRIDIEEGSEIVPKMKLVMFRNDEDCVPVYLSVVGKVTKVYKNL